MDDDCNDTTDHYEYEDYDDYYEAINNIKTSKCKTNLCPENSSCSSCQFCLPDRHLGNDLAGGMLLAALSPFAGRIGHKSSTPISLTQAQD